MKNRMLSYRPKLSTLHAWRAAHKRGELFRGSLLSNPVSLGLLLDKVRRKRLLCVSGEGKSLSGCKSKSENLGKRDMKMVAWSNQQIRKWPEAAGFQRICSSLWGGGDNSYYFQNSPWIQRQNLFHASGLWRRGIIKLSDRCQNLLLGRQMHVLCREVVWGGICWLLHAHKLFLNEEPSSSPLAPGTSLVMMIILILMPSLVSGFYVRNK